ncbi:MAG: hypothetical protein DWI24_08685 [Planctomycetota bacterium]|nr:MAG: hypothetical protein DWI24_08685 [Planctomycetota bacterium]
MIFQGLSWIQGFVGMMDWSSEPQKEQKKGALIKAPFLGFSGRRFYLLLLESPLRTFLIFGILADSLSSVIPAKGLLAEGLWTGPGFSVESDWAPSLLPPQPEAIEKKMMRQKRDATRHERWERIMKISPKGMNSK